MDRFALMSEPELRAECRRLDALLNTPSIADYVEAVRLEAAHQRVRWGDAHDAAKSPAEFAGVGVFLMGKALDAAWKRDQPKLLHRIVAVGALCANWHRVEAPRA